MVSIDDAVYVCMSARDMPVPYVPCHKGKCRDCKQDVFYSKYSYANDATIRKIIDAGNIVCTYCAEKLAKKDSNPKVKIRKSTLKELASTYVDDKQP